MNQKFPDRSLLYLLIVFIGFSVLFGIDFMGDPRPTEETPGTKSEPNHTTQHIKNDHGPDVHMPQPPAPYLKRRTAMVCGAR